MGLVTPEHFAVLCCSLFVFVEGIGQPIADAATLLQAGAPLHEANASNAQNSQPVPPTLAPLLAPDANYLDIRVRTYRIMFTKTYGDDHTCLTEIELYGERGNRLNATLMSMSSCYGCVTCDNCVHRYGNPNVIFDGVAAEDGEDAWSCTAPGTFTDSVGLQNLVFKNQGRIFKVVVRRPQIDGDWLTREFSLEEQVQDGSWHVIMTKGDAPRELNQVVEIDEYPVLEGRRDGAPWFYHSQDEWKNNWQSCGFGRMQSPIPLDPMPEGQLPPTEENRLPYSYVTTTNHALMNTGRGLQVAANLGNLTLPSGIYEATQFHFHFPAEHIIGGDAHLAVGELHIVHKRIGFNGSVPPRGDDIAMVSILLHLPKEHEQLNNQEMWFLDLGMLAIPREGHYTPPIQEPLSFAVFEEQLNGNYWYYKGSLATPPCVEGVQWFVMEKPAHISGSVIVAFTERMAQSRWFKEDGGNAREPQALNGRVPLVNSYSM